MAKLPLTLDTLGEVDQGAARLIVDREIARAIEDLDDRGEDGKPRKVVIQLTLEKQTNGLVEAHVEVQARIPPRRTAATVGLVQKQRGKAQSELVFQQWAPDNPEQNTLDIMDQNKE